ncbi:DUF4191 domain-containing protein [Dermatophilus congolensis]|uniref:Uncharacterized protein n=1 Tax=Dermatophilus congolensis TaxID=1863 RepID=A0A239VNY4_9MICO|nr:DUF4191 domain-containing protein [Dermatophilus congolensis]MBO3129543.1 DUF4191 family protein [Dermatophilus congolensis]MBO3131824.1 DUF4191 family protein [Dermatophilus congolensis]MBO3134019.1 DUF4191 family protein [Dermatophilus congolensis]MBO3136251.1 DUF4191 family protein [Dermatophilus congolensis]MBO3138498.1 DUF4191 family protein [Dermatophilus congolensis]
MATSERGNDKPKKKRFSQLKQVFELASRERPRILWEMIGIIVGMALLGAVIGGSFGHPIYGGFLAVLLGVLAAMWLLSKTAERAAYASLEGQPGAGGALLQSVRGWAVEQEPVAIEGGRNPSMHDAALVYRAVGRPGVVLVAEGPRGRATRLLANESKKTARLVPNVPVHTFRLGHDEGEDATRPTMLTKQMRKLPKNLTKHEVGEVDRRLHALGRVKAPIPAGIDPTKARQMGKGQRRR